MRQPHIYCLFLVAALLTALVGCSSDPATPADSAVSLSAQDPDTAVLYVHGMGCPQCANNVDTQLLKVEGVEDVAIDMGSGRVLARLAPERHPTRDQLARAVEETGFTLVRIEMPE